MPMKNIAVAPANDPEIGQGDPLYVVGEELTAAEAAVVDDAVEHINAAVNRSGVDLAADVASYVLETFFDGSYDAFLDPSRYKARSFSALCQREDLALSRASLYALVRVGHQLDELPAPIAHALTMRHHRALLPLDDPAEKRALARKAIDERWTVTALEAEVRAIQPPKRSGRPPLPAVVKQLRAVQRAFATAEPAAPLPELSDDQREELEATLTELEARITSLRQALGSHDGPG
ncbi:MAG: hypothetical protein CVU56_22090 [Deltaproteobacteria bacterium HGW-Deltaproteobacteria-14]|jgi:hypothetical protein|nr:MAG: hypothetical protein CVU56_22090 [Deltaproteobacteria bacterium HGW-Deltaproteobacteria-14]